ncbi:MAG: GNAT family N-acetyltransferase [Promethearchaeota archaeon]
MKYLKDLPRGFSFRKMNYFDKSKIIKISQQIWNGNDYILKTVDKWLNQPDCQMLGIFKGAKLIAFINTRKYTKDLIRLEGGRVDPQYQNKGIGTCLLDYALEYAKASGALKVQYIANLQNQVSMKLAEKFEFSRISEICLMKLDLKELFNDKNKEFIQKNFQKLVQNSITDQIKRLDINRTLVNLKRFVNMDEDLGVLQFWFDWNYLPAEFDVLKKERILSISYKDSLIIYNDLSYINELIENRELTENTDETVQNKNKEADEDKEKKLPTKITINLSALGLAPDFKVAITYLLNDIIKFMEENNYQDKDIELLFFGNDELAGVMKDFGLREFNEDLNKLILFEKNLKDWND